MQQDTFVKERTALAVQPEQGEDTIDLLELFMGLLAHWTLIAATAVVGAVLMALYTFFLVTPMYKATATIYVVSRNDSVLNFSDLQVGSELTSDYIKVFEMWEVHERSSATWIWITPTPIWPVCCLSPTPATPVCWISRSRTRIRKKQQRSQTSMRMWAQSTSRKNDERRTSPP